MKPYNVVEARKQKNGIIVHTVDYGNGEPKTFPYDAIRGGFSWPTPESKAYFCILGEEHLPERRFEIHKDKRGKLKLLREKEIESFSLVETFKPLSDSCAEFLCEDVYTDLLKGAEGSVSDEIEFFRQWRWENKIKFDFVEAPYCDNFQLGISIIRYWLGESRLVLPEKSIAREQLAAIQRTDLSDKPEIRFPAVNALRHTICAFHKHRPMGRFFKPPRVYRPRRTLGVR